MWTRPRVANGVLERNPHDTSGVDLTRALVPQEKVWSEGRGLQNTLARLEPLTNVTATALPLSFNTCS